MRGMRKNKVVFNMGLTPALKNEVSGGSQNCTLESSFAAVQFARDSSGENRDLLKRKVCAMAFLKRDDPNQKKEKPAENTGNPTARIGLMAIVSAYIIYLGVSIIRGYLSGEPGGMPGWAAILIGVFFIVFGAGYIFILWKQYRQLQEKEARESAAQESIITDGGVHEADTEEEEAQSDGMREDETFSAESDGSDLFEEDPIENNK